MDAAGADTVPLRKMDLYGAMKATEIIKRVSGDEPPTRLGVAKSSHAEAKCQLIHLFMRRVGLTAVGVGLNNTYKRRLALPPQTTINEAVQHFRDELPNDTTQSDVADENGFLFADSTLDMPISAFSSGCALNLDLIHEHKSKHLPDVRIPYIYGAQPTPTP